MSIVVKAGTGLFAGIVAGLLGLAFLPQGAPNAVKPRRAVEKPQFVAAKQAPAPQVETTAAIVVAKETTPARPAPSVEATPPVEAKPAAPATPAAAVAIAPLAPVAVAAAPVAPAAAIAAPLRESPAAAPDPVAKATNETAARFSVPGLIALAKGDLSTARLFLARAAEAGDARAWVALADTYDPAILAKLGVVGATGDPQRAKTYLGKAAAAGILVPKDRIAALDQSAGPVQ